MNELYSWAQSNSFPWESWEETRARYESMYGAVSEDDEPVEDTENVNWEEDWLESQAPEKIKEEEGFLDWLPSMSEFGSAAAKSWDETQASGATIGETLVAPALDYLGFKETADDIKEWAPGYREEQLAEADQYDEVLSRKQKRLAEDPNYVPAETREETLARLQAEGGLGYEVAKHVPEFLPLTTEKAIEDFPTAGEVGSFATGSAVPMVGAAAVGLPALALGGGALVAGGLAMGTGALLSSALVSSETADNIKNNPVIRVALGIDDKTPFEKLPPTDQQLIKKVAEDGAQTNLGQRMISSGIPEMLGYIPAGGWLLRAVTDIAGGTASEVWDISVSRDSMVSALLENGVDQSKVIELDAALQAIGPKKSEVFMKALVGEAVATGPITGAEQIVMSKLPKKMHYVDVGATVTEENRKQQEKAQQDEIKGAQDQFKKASEQKRTAGELAERLVRTWNTDPDAATQDLQDYKLNDRQVQNNIQKILGAEYPKILEDMTKRIGDKARQKEFIKELEKSDNKRQKLAEKEAKKVEKEAETLKKEEDEKFKYVDAEEKVKAYEAGYAKQLDLERTPEQIAVWDKVNRPLQAIKDLETFNASIEKEQKKAADKVKADTKAKKTETKTKKKVETAKVVTPEVEKEVETTKVVTPEVEKEVETASDINDLAGRFERVRLNNQPGKSDKSYKFSPPESEMIGKPGSDKWLKFQKARKKYRETDSQYIQTNLDRLSEFVAKNPQDKDVLEGTDLDFIKKNQKEFDSRLAEIKKPVKEEVKPEYKVPNLEPILKKGDHDQVIEDAGGTGGDPATDKVEGGAKVPVELLYPRRKQRVEDIKGDYDEGMMNYEDYKEDLETIIQDDINDGKYAEDTDMSDVWDNKDMDSVSLERFAKALVKQQKTQVKADKTTSKSIRIFPMLSDSEYKGDPEYSLNKDETIKLVDKFKARTNLKGKDVDITTLSKNDKADQAMITELLGEESAQDVLDTAEGFVHSGKVYIVAENIEGTVKAADPSGQSAGNRLVNTLFHEILGHYGLKKLLGNSYNPFINRFIKLNKKMLDKYAMGKSGVDYLPESVRGIKNLESRKSAYNALTNKSEVEFVIAEEYIARNFAEFGARDPNIKNRIVVALRNYISSIPMFKDMGITTDQVKVIMAELQQEYIGGKRNFISGEDFKTLDTQLDTTEEEDVEAKPEEVTTKEVEKVETLTLTDKTEEGKILKSIKQSKALGLYAKYNKDAGADGTLLLHKNTIPDQGKYRITFFRANGDLDTSRTENGHEHFPTLKKAKDRLSEIGEGIQDITGGRAVNMSKKITQPTRETDSTLDYVQDKGMRGAEIDREYLELELRWLRKQEAKGRKLPKVNLSKKASPFDLVLEEAEADIDSVPFVKAAGKRREEAAKVKAMRKTNAERAGAAYRLNISDEAVNKYIESKADEGHGSLVGAMTLPNMSKIPKKYRGEVAVGMIADRLIRGNYIPYHGRKSKHAKNLKLNGGPMYAFDKKRNTGKGGRAAWASQKGPISKIYNAVMGQDTDGNIISNGANYGFIILGKEDMHMSNIDVWAVAYGEAMDAVEFSGADMALLDKNAEEAILRYAPRFKGKIKTFVELMELGKLNELQARGKYGKELTFEKRKPILEFMFKPTKAKANNLLNIEELSNRTSAYPDAKMGDLVGIIKFHKNKSNFKTTAEDLGIETHPSYKHILQGEGIYTFKKPIPINEFARGWLMEKRRTYTKGKLTAVQTPFFRKGQTEFSSEKDVKIGKTFYSNMFYSAELISWLTGQPVTSGKLHTDWKTAKTEYEAELEIQKDTLTEAELKEWRKNNKPPVRSVITEKPPRGERYKSRGGVAASKAAVRSIELKASLININPDMLINPIPAKDVKVNMSKKVGTMNAYKAAKVAQGRLTDEGLFWIPTFKAQDKLSNELTKRLVSQGTLPDMELFKDIRRKNKGVVFKAQQGGEKLFAILKKSKQQKVLYDYFVTPNADANTITNKKERQAAKDAKDQIQLIGRDLVEAGLMTQKSLDKFDDQYLPRKYLKYLLRDKDYRAIDQGGAGVNVDLGYTKARKDIPKGVRELILGEVKDPAFLSSIAISTPIRDLAILDMFEQIATEGLNKKRGWVLPSTLVKFDILGEMKKLTNNDTALIEELQLMDTEGVMMSGHWLLNEAERIRDRVDNHMMLEPAKDKLVRNLINSMTTKGNEIIKNVVVPKNFRRVPKGRKYGRLSGMAIRKEIFEDMFGWGSKGNTFDINDDGTIDASWAEKVLGTGGTFEQYNRIWKWSKVSANPPSWVRNFVSNLIFMSLGPVPLPRMPDLFLQALTDQLKTRYVQQFGTQKEFDALESHTKIADEMGLTSGGFSQAELKTIRNEFVSSKNKAGGALGLLRIRDSFKKAALSFQRGTSDLYGGIDTLGKVMMVKYLMKSKGASKEVAASQAEKYLFDYSNPLPSVKYLRKSAFGAPFLSYPSFVAPVLIETIIKRPWKFAPYILMAEYMKESFKSEQDISDEEYQAVMSTLSEYLHKRANEKGDLSLIPESVLPLPNKDALNRAQIVDVGYFYPFGMFSEVFRQLNPFKEGGSEVTGAMHTLGLMGSPLLNIAVTSLTGRDPFTDRQIHDELATPAQKYSAWFNYGFNLTLPPMFHGISPIGGAYSPVGANPNAGGFGAITRLYEAYSDKVGREGEPKFTKAQALARMVGLNITPIAPFEARAKQVYFESQKIKKLQRGISQKVEKALRAQYTKKEIDDLVKYEIGIINRLVEKLNKRISKKLPASLKRSKMDLIRSREKYLKYLKTMKAG